MPGLVLAIRLVLALAFGIAGIAKLSDRDGSRAALRGFGVPAWLAEPGVSALPLIELLIAACLLASLTAWWGLIASGVLLVLFGAAIGLSMARGVAPECHCFGQLHSRPTSSRMLVRNGGLAALCGVAFASGPEAAHLSGVDWLEGLGTPALILFPAGALLVAVVAVQGWFMFRMLRQHGRVLGRLEALEIGAGGMGEAARGRDALAAAANRLRATDDNGHAPGLAVGSLAPEFDLPSLDGRLRVSLSRLRVPGAPVVLVFTNPGCGACNALLPDIADWQKRYGGRLTIAVVSRGVAATTGRKAHEYSLNNVLLQQHHEVAASYHAPGVPAAVLVSPDGRIASSPAVGVVAITALVGGVGGGGALALSGAGPEDRDGNLVGGTSAPSQSRRALSPAATTNPGS